MGARSQIPIYRWVPEVGSQTLILLSILWPVSLVLRILSNVFGVFLFRFGKDLLDERSEPGSLKSKKSKEAWI